MEYVLLGSPKNGDGGRKWAFPVLMSLFGAMQAIVSSVRHRLPFQLTRL
ncbi:MAG: hypothetical protein Ct9H300mP11_09340 [Chloroflexota bacterium]|nr:MAG: hypothetical protein Ct9H300mP11_09340 [Chloroflexota bacterium]